MSEGYKEWTTGDIVKIGCIKNLKVLAVHRDKSMKPIYILQRSNGDVRQYKYHFGRALERYYGEKNFE